MIIKAFLLFIVLLVIGGFGYFAISDPAIQQSQITKTLSLEEINNSQNRNDTAATDEQAE